MSSKEKRNALVLFAKAPVAGKVKTRMQPEITADDSARLQAALIKDSILLMSKINNADKFIYFHPEGEKKIFEKFTCELSFHLNCQNGADLGEKMENAFRYLFDNGYSKVVIIGADSPTLPEKHINKAFMQLNKADLVIGPSIDGGYYLIGFREKVCPVFSSVEWGSNKVLTQTEELIKRHNLHLSLLPVHYDIDTIENLRFLRTHIQLMQRSGEDVSANTMNILEDILSS